MSNNLGNTTRRYTNHEDQDGSAIYMQARTYLPTYGKFAQVDPAYDQTKDDPESWNLYNYVTNNPVTHTDPDGREASLGTMGVGFTNWFWDAVADYDAMVAEAQRRHADQATKDLPGSNNQTKPQEGRAPEAKTTTTTSTSPPAEDKPATETAQTGIESKNALTAEEKAKKGPQIVDMTHGEFRQENPVSKAEDTALTRQIAYDQASVVTSTPNSARKDLQGSADTKIVVFHARHAAEAGEPANRVYVVNSKGEKVSLGNAPIHVSGSQIYLVGCRMDVQASKNLFTFDKGARVIGVDGTAGLNRGTQRALIMAEGRPLQWGSAELK